MASKSWIPAVGLSLVLWALVSCARDGPVLEQASQAETRPDTSACRKEEDEPSEEELAVFAEQLEQIDPKELEAQAQEMRPVVEAVYAYFSALREQAGRAGPASATAEGRRAVFSSFQTSDSMAATFFSSIEHAGHDMSRERACTQLYPTKLQIEPDCRPAWYFFCWREPELELLSTYRQDATGWVKAGTP